MKYKEGDIITDGILIRVILGVCGRIYHVSNTESDQAYNFSWTERELEARGYKKKEVPREIWVNNYPSGMAEKHYSDAASANQCAGSSRTECVHYREVIE